MLVEIMKSDNAPASLPHQVSGCTTTNLLITHNLDCVLQVQFRGLLYIEIIVFTLPIDWGKLPSRMTDSFPYASNYFCSSLSLVYA